MKNGLVIPCFNFEKGIANTVRQIEQWRSKQATPFQVCFVDDCSTDSTHQFLIEQQTPTREWLKVIRLPQNSGKGAAVRAGLSELTKDCEFVFFTDCDLHYGLKIISERLLLLLKENDIVIADRSWVSSSSHEAVSRRMSSYIFNRIVGLLTGVIVRDSQAGCKGFRSSTLEPMLPLLKIDGFAFDVEILSLARFYRLRLAQVPVQFEDKYAFPAQSSVKLLYSSIHMLLDIVRVNLLWKKGHYYSAALERRIEKQIFLIQDQSQDEHFRTT